MADIEEPVRTTSVTIRSDRFTPHTIEVAPGDAVTWTNEDAHPHTVSSAEIESGVIDGGSTYTCTFDRPGHYRYFCMFHPRSVGEVFVR